ncbi:isochorismate synthase [Ferrimonas aestuarii]|uniref:Isochorismate synthase MenF n=1 Tax=Ferrimonas aestuarii TaxID=2569539 RepID=A0A4V5NVT4_9GAMM|nr:isochorismate synthase [Ferrimonas aestuarii]TKB51742.1 isochorismate synthase [Ferrimonas aestuarii]
MEKLSLTTAVGRLQTQLAQLAHPDANSPFLQLVQSMESTLLFPWLSAQQQWPQLYWRSRNQGEEVAALGCCHKIHIEQGAQQQLQSFYRQHCCDKTSDLRWYGGVAFDASQPQWRDFGAAHFMLPRLEIRQQDDEAKLIVHLNTQAEDWQYEIEQAQRCLQQLNPLKPLPRLTPGHILSRTDTPNHPKWIDLVEQVTEPKFNAITPKVVLSRQTELKLNNTPHPWTVLHAWQLLNPNSYQYGFRVNEQRSFISCSPEKLFIREHGELTTEALAGTTIRGLTPEQDQQLAQELLDDPKNQYENQLVRILIERQLQPYCDYVGTDEAPSILKLNHIQHLHRTIRAEIKADVDDLQLLKTLHPTPAVGGLPRANAMEFIGEHEGYVRGWYAGACGYFNGKRSEFSVAIRSALINDDNVALFAGAGIVGDSDPESEWQELENKLATIMGILNSL